MPHESMSGWKQLEELGRGGQGIVFKAQSPKRTEELRRAARRAWTLQSQWGPDQVEKYEEFAHLLSQLADGQSDDYGALKRFHLGERDTEEYQQRLDRLMAEVEALKTLSKLGDSAILKLYAHSSPDSNEPFIVTEYHRTGTLDKNLTSFKGKPLKSLEALFPVVKAVAKLHERGVIHRDIKPENIFVADDGRLVLGDFGIVFFSDDATDRLTKTYEKVGTRDWMAHWAQRNVRLELDKVNPKLDIYPLGKVLWAMIAGEDGFPAWDFDHRDNDLRVRFPDDPAIDVIHPILKRCIVRDEQDCLNTADDLMILIRDAIKHLQKVVERPSEGRTWKCRMCGEGKYVKNKYRYYQQYGPDEQGKILSADAVHRYSCDHCGHIEFFLHD